MFKKNLKEFRSCVTVFNKWFDEICNSFNCPWSNGPLEGTHTKIKTLKKNCFGMKNFNLFKKELCLHVSSVRKTGKFAKPLGVLLLCLFLMVF
ncbi:transposase [uncultured Peptoniphilus sp.]|uniref:transposase n=1 Tax=uncultured Peptoniphilus sp. TaxID=254354 RepID=UPI00338ED27B